MKAKTFYLLFLLTAFFTSLQAQNSPYISRVIEYRPAPGQHINRLFPPAAMSTTPENALLFANNMLTSQNDSRLLGLGGFGGYVIVTFDRPVVNVPNEYDLRTTGNNFFITNTNIGAMAEPGIVMVCQDLNKNGTPDPDEPWYELAGSAYWHPETIHNYEITYYRPNPDQQQSNIPWTDNQGNSGEIEHIIFATQSTMYPLWIEENTMTFKGTKLPGNITQMEHNYDGEITTIIVQESFEWGYADNNVNIFDSDTQTYTEPIETTGLKIDWAVDENGNSVHLDYIDFVKIYTGQLQQIMPLGETSTELTGMGGVIDLHPEAVLEGIETDTTHSVKLIIHNNRIMITETNGIITLTNIYNLTGNVVMSNIKDNDIDISHLPTGIYLLQVRTPYNTLTQKIIKK